MSSARQCVRFASAERDGSEVEDTQEWETLAGRRVLETILTPLGEAELASMERPTMIDWCEDRYIQLAVLLSDAREDNAFFRSPIPSATGADAPLIIDLRSGSECLWAAQVCDKYQPAGTSELP
jgi:hypothetical protein